MAGSESKNVAVSAPWELGAEVDEVKVARLAEETKMSAGLCKLLVRRGIESAAAAKAYLKPAMAGLHDPFLMKDMDKMIDALMDVYKTPGRKIGIHGDYDADGLTSTSLLTLVLSDLGFAPVPFVPDRVKDGYGVSVQALRDFKKQGIETVLTCDTGVSAYEEIRQGVEDLGLRILISDHHTTPDLLPPTDVIVNPQRKDCAYPFKGLCGVGVAYKILQGLCQRLGIDEQVMLHKHLDLVAIGTICDVMPLADENRIFVRWGIRQAKSSFNPGLRALFERIGLTAEKLDERAISWKVGPRLNAAGRIDKSEKGLQLLTCKTAAEAQVLANELESINNKRKEMTRRVEEEALAQAKELLAKEPSLAALALFAKPEAEAWHPGLMGLVAPRVMQKTGRPVFAFAWDAHSQGWKGSGRTPANGHVNLHAALKEVHAQGLVNKYGGHAEAAGVTILGEDEANKTNFAKALDAAIKGQKHTLTFIDPAGQPEEQVWSREKPTKAEQEMNLAEVDLDLAKLLKYFGPFGQGNQPLVFWGKNCEVVSSKLFGKKEGVAHGGVGGNTETQENMHIRMNIKQGENTIQAIGWGLAESLKDIHEAPKPAIAQLMFQVAEDTFRNQKEVRLTIEDAKLGIVREIAPEKVQESGQKSLGQGQGALKGQAAKKRGR